MTLAQLPLINALLNSVSALFLLGGWYCIKNKYQVAHVCCMLSAFVTSCLFLTCYLIYHFNIPGHHVAFTAIGWPRLVYFFILFTHLPLALAVLPLVVMTFTPALQKHFDRHKKIAKWTLPIWLYVSVTGVLVYCMLYLWFPKNQSLNSTSAAKSCVAPVLAPSSTLSTLSCCAPSTSCSSSALANLKTGFKPVTSTDAVKSCVAPVLAPSSVSCRLTLHS